MRHKKLKWSCSRVRNWFGCIPNVKKRPIMMWIYVILLYRRKNTSFKHPFQPIPPKAIHLLTKNFRSANSIIDARREAKRRGCFKDDKVGNGAKMFEVEHSATKFMSLSGFWDLLSDRDLSWALLRKNVPRRKLLTWLLSRMILSNPVNRLHRIVISLFYISNKANKTSLKRMYPQPK